MHDDFEKIYLSLWLGLAMAGLWQSLAALSSLSKAHPEASGWVRINGNEFVMVDHYIYQTGARYKTDDIWLISLRNNKFLIVGDRPTEGAWLIPFGYNYRDDLIKETGADGFYKSVSNLNNYYSRRIFTGITFFIVGATLAALFWQGWKPKPAK
ncbi:MAG: hypothetical protein WCL04_02830 [Verrucomicrobiota bacterium]